MALEESADHEEEGMGLGISEVQANGITHDESSTESEEE